MSSSDDKQDNEQFFRRLDEGLTSFFTMSEEDISAEDLEFSFPIQKDLSDLDSEYELVEQVGKGAMKLIYKVRELKTNRYVAMAKMVDAQTKESVESFLREARLTSLLEHPNIVTIHDMGIGEGGEPYFTMELLKGRTLAEVIKQAYSGDPTVRGEVRDELLSIFTRVCDAMDYAHSKHVVHLDLKPQNIHVGEYGEVIIMDWGLAKILVEDDEDIYHEVDPNELNHATLRGVIKGTPGYMAPEQARPNMEKDKRSDVYALGAILYSCLTGGAPIEGDSVDRVLEQTQEGVVDSPNERLDRALIAPGLEALVMKALAVNPDDRYPSVAALKEDLEKYSMGYATEAEDAGFLKQLKLLLIRHKRTVAILAASMAVITGIVGFAFTHISMERTKAVMAREEAVGAKKDAEEAQRVAEENLRLLKDEQDVSARLRENVEGFLEDVLESGDVSSAQRKVELLDSAIASETDQKKLKALLKRKGVLHFVLQDFDAALRSFEASQVREKSNYYRLAQLGKKLKGDADYLDDKGLSELLSRMGARHADVIFNMYERYMKFQRDPSSPVDGYRPLATVMLNMNNRIWHHERHQEFISFEGGKLDLSGRPYRNFRNHYGEGYNILAPFEADHIDVSNTLFFEFIQFHDLRFSTLNLLGCSVNQINKTRCEMMQGYGIERVIVDSRLLSVDEVALLTQQFEVHDVAPLVEE
ncbi:serine/threonine protein kinase [Rubritalea tangerina]|uniref:Serine/threonine protein kinase n=1 Tax=Rubritalea tangerina TaxID=430798 RepID=A0ABW4Z8V2_9BACT